MKKALVSILLVGALMTTLAGCKSKDVNPQSNDDKKTAAAEVQKNDSAAAKTEDKKADTAQTPEAKKTETAPAAPVQTPAKKQDNTAAQPVQPAAPAPQAPADFISNTPTTSIDSIQVSPKHVYYKDSKLYMDAFVYNGYKHNVFNIRNIQIRLSNKTGVIAEAGFDGMGNTNIAPNSYIVWTFIFDTNTIKMQNADLQYLKTDFQCDNSY